MNGDEQSDDDDDAYWNQYDQFAGVRVAGQAIPSVSEEIKESQQGSSNDAYYDQYDNIETTIGDSNLMQDSVAEAEKPSGGGGTIAAEALGNSELADTALDEYVRDTVRNLSRFALRSGISKARACGLRTA